VSQKRSEIGVDVFQELGLAYDAFGLLQDKAVAHLDDREEFVAI